MQLHYVEVVQLRVDGGKQGGDNREVLGDVVCDGERRQRAPGYKQLLADLDDVDELGGVGVEVDHVARLFGCRRARVHGDTDVCLGERRRVVGPVAHHRHELAARLLGPDQLHLALWRGLGEVVVHARLLRYGSSGEGVVARDHDGADAH